MQNQMPPIQSPDNTFHDGNPLTGELGTIVTALFMNNVQSAIRNAQAEILSVLTDAGISADPAKSDQLLAALKKNFVLQARKVNNKALSADITLGAGDVGAYTKAETDTKVNAATTAANNANDNANGRVPSERKVNGKALNADITLGAGDVGALAKDQNGADIPDKSLFRQNVGLVKQTGQFDATAGSMMLNGAWGLGGVGVNLNLNAANFLTWARTVANGSTFFRNLAGNIYTKQYGAGIFSRAGDTWAAISCGYSSINNANIAGVRVAAGNNTNDVNVYELWTDKNLVSPATLDTEQTFSAVKSFSQRPIISAQFTGMTFDASSIPSGTLGRVLELEYEGQRFVNFYRRTARSQSSGQQVVSLYFPTTGNGVILVQGNNAESDANGIWKVPGSAGLTPASIGALSVSDLAGIPLPYPGAVAPAGWLKCNGQSFNTTQYPVLASRYPSGVLPDLRAEFIRGFDDGRGVDTGRVLLSHQDDEFRSHTHQINSRSNNGSADTYVEDADASGIVRNAITEPTGGAETRPRNTAFNYIVRAA